MPQLLHAPPPAPHAVFAVPAWHLPVESQQPEAQFVGPQVVVIGWQAPLVHTCWELHWAQGLPPVPHAV